MDKLNVKISELRRPNKTQHHITPSCSQSYVLEVEPTHVLRICDIISCHCEKNGAYALASQETKWSSLPAYVLASQDGDSAKRTIPPYLLFTTNNTATNDALPPEFFKYITRHFYTPFSCYDADWLVMRILAFVERENLSDGVFKIVTSPKELQQELASVLSESSNLQMQLLASASTYTHLLHVVFLREESLFRWGISSQAFAKENLLTNEYLASALEISRNQSGSDELTARRSEPPPVCRAYYKVKEIFEQQFPKVLGWTMPDPALCISCDVGAAPGGWTQILAQYSSRVLSIDPGLLHPSVLALPNVTYIPETLQNSNIGEVLSDLAQSRLKLKVVVCDVNFEPAETARMLCEFLLPFIDGLADCDQCPSRSGSNSSYVILTLKLMKKPKQHHIDRVVERVLAIITDCSGPHSKCWSFHAVHLAANSKNERTLCMKLH